MGPETYDSLGNETYLTCNVLTKGTGKEHLVDSCIFDNGTTTCIKNNLIGTGTISGTNIYGSTAVCSAVGKFTTCIDAGSGTFGSSVRSNSHFIVSDGSAANVVLQGYINNALRIAESGSASSGGARGNLYVGVLDVGGASVFSGDLCVSTAGSTAVLFDGTNPTLTLRRNNNGNASAAINFKGSSAVKWQIGTNQATGLGFEINEGDATANKFYIAPGGAASFACSVGIGTTLAVTGTTSLSCRLSIGASDQYYASVFVGGALTCGSSQYAIITDPQLSGTDSSYALYANARIKASTAVTNAFGVYIPSAEKLSGATITNNYALYIANQTSGATLNYSIYSSGGTNYFGGCVGIGTTTPSYSLDINDTNGNGVRGMRISTSSTSVGPSIVLRYTPGGLTNWLVGTSQAISNALEFIASNSVSGDPGTAGTTRMLITPGGNVAIGRTDDRGYRLSVQNTSATVLNINRTTSDGSLIDFEQDGSLEGTISVSGTTVSYNSFLGSHWSQLIDNSKPEILKGTILEAIDELCTWEGETNDRLPKVKISDTVESKKVYGIFLDWDNDDTINNDMYVAAVGAGYIRVNSSQDISIGDLLQSNGDGTAKIQSDDIMLSSTIAKVVSTNKIETYEDGSYLVAATLHCG